MNLVKLKKHPDYKHLNDDTHYSKLLVDSDDGAFSVTPAEDAVYEVSKKLTNQELKNRLSERMDQLDSGSLGSLTAYKNTVNIFHQSEEIQDGASLSIFFRLTAENLTNHELVNISYIEKENNGAYRLKVKISGDNKFYIVEQQTLIFQDTDKKTDYQLYIELVGIGEHNGSSKEYKFWAYNKRYFTGENFHF